MDANIFSDFTDENAATERLEVPSLSTSISESTKNVADVVKIEPLTTKNAVKLLLEGKLKSRVCRYCLNVTPGLSELDQIMKIAGTGTLYKVTIKDIVASFHPFKVAADENFPDKICQSCLDRALSAYTFTQQCERAERAMLNCFDDIYEKFVKLDPLQRPKKRGRQKLNPNYNVLNAEHYKVIDYAEPIINMINVEAESVTKEPGINNFECKKCWQVLPNIESLLNHEKIHPKTMWYHCRLCGKSFPKPNLLKKHTHKVHILGAEIQPVNANNFKCSECGQVTDNFINHLQHIEKHKFRYMLENIVGRRMNELCVVCFKEGTSMVDLDNIVCIHGGHPDLMGDRNLYSILATTLPNPTKHYKYQELHISIRPPVMCIKNMQNAKKMISITHSLYKEELTFAYPIILTRNSLKTNHFYHYVLASPEIVNIINEIIILDSSDDEMYPKATVTEIYDSDESTEEIISNRKDSGVNVVEIDTENDSESMEYNIIENFEYRKIIDSESIQVIDVDDTQNKILKCSKKTLGFKDIETFIEIEDSNSDKENNNINDKVSTPCNTKEYIPVIFKFSDPELMSDEYNNLLEIENIIHGFIPYQFTNAEAVETDGIITESVSPTPSPCNKIIEMPIIEPINVRDRKRLRKDLNGARVTRSHCNDCKVNDIQTENLTSNIDDKEIECKFCCLFKKIEKCNNCKKLFEQKSKEPQLGRQFDDVSTEDSQELDVINVDDDSNIWQCRVCLITNNIDRVSCHCCGTEKVNKNTDMRITLKKTEIFVTKKTENIEEPEIDNNYENAKNDINQNFIVEDSFLMDFNTDTADNLNAVFGSTIQNIQNMEIDSNSELDNDIEKMEVEVNPITLCREMEWNSPLFQLHIDNNDLTDLTSSVKADVQFTIGSITENPRNVKKPLRKIPKKFSK